MRIHGLSRASLVWILLLAATLSQLSLVTAADNFDSLVAAIQAANSGGSGEITLSGDIVLAAALPPITGSLTIDGAGHSISGAGEYRIFDVSGARLVIRNLTLTKGDGEDGGALRMRFGARVEIVGSTFSDNRAATGGAITTHGLNSRLTIENSSFSGNRSKDWAGAIDVVGSTVTIIGSSFTNNSSLDYGGALVTSASNVQISNSTFHNNRAIYAAAIQVYGDEVTLTHVTMTDNIARIGVGNAINRQGGIVRLRNSIVADGVGEDCSNGLDEAIGNLSTDGTCSSLPTEKALLDELAGTPAWRPLLDASPAIDAAEAEFCLETDQLGTPRPQGDGCDIGAFETTTAMPAPPPIEPPPPCPLSLKIVAANTDAPAGGCPAGSGHDIIVLEGDIELEASLPAITSDITIEGNGFTIDGRRRYRIFRVQRGKLTINNMTLTRGLGPGLNTGGGAVWLEAVGRLEANDVVFSNNRASTGGAIGSKFWNISFTVNDSHFVNNSASNGGAIGMNGGGHATITNSSFVNNEGDYSGGAINSTSGTVTVSNSTFVGNQAPKGGAISADGSGTDRIPITLTHVTMLNNSAFSGDGIYIAREDYNDFAVRLRNSIMVDDDGKVDDCSARLAQNANNFIADGSCSPMLSGDPMLQEMDEAAAQVALAPGSPAIDAADPRYCTEYDQTGRPRPLGYGCDIGAIELMPEPEALSGCQATTTHNLNFRDSPKGIRIGSVPFGAKLEATARTPRWFEVEHEGTTGWISADYVIAEGECG